MEYVYPAFSSHSSCPIFPSPAPFCLIPSANVLSYPEFFGVTGRVNFFQKIFIKLYQVDICQKRLSYDEAHRVTQNTSVAGQLEADMTTMARESRKWNLSIGLYTQSIDDIPKIIIELSSTIVILGAGTDKGIAELSDRFALNGACRHALSHLGKPGPAGSNLVALFRTGAGLSQLVLSMTIGGQALWAFSTTTEDVSIRNSLYRRMEPSEALRRLAARFPGGSAKAEVERRRRQVTDQSGVDDVLVNVIQEVVNEIAQAPRAS